MDATSAVVKSGEEEDSTLLAVFVSVAARAMLCLRGVLEASNPRGAEALAPSTREPTPRAALVSLRNLPPLHFVGYLTKQGHRVKNWKRRWVALTEGGSLSYSEEKGDAKGKGAVRLAHAPLPRAQKSSCLPMSQAARISIRTPQDSAAAAPTPPLFLQLSIGSASITPQPEERYRRAHVFCVVNSTGEALVLQADSASDRDDWMAALQRVAASALSCSGNLLQVAGWRKKWRVRYLLLSGSKLAW